MYVYKNTTTASNSSFYFTYSGNYSSIQVIKLVILNILPFGDVDLVYCVLAHVLEDIISMLLGILTLDAFLAHINAILVIIMLHVYHAMFKIIDN